MILFYGSWERRLGQIVYMISAKCDDCIVNQSGHKMDYIVSPFELELIQIDPFPRIRAYIEQKFIRTHYFLEHL